MAGVDIEEPKPYEGPQWRTVANLLSFARLILTPVLGWLILKGHTSIATALFGAMGISDYLDGYIARRTNTVTDLGTTLDPISDRVLVMVALVTMMIGGPDGAYLPLWLSVPVLLREAALSIAFLFLARRGFGKPKVKRVGKTATFALLTALPGFLLGGVLRPVAMVIGAVGMVLYYVAGYRYFKDMQAFLEKERRPFAPELQGNPEA